MVIEVNSYFTSNFCFALLIVIVYFVGHHGSAVTADSLPTSLPTSLPISPTAPSFTPLPSPNDSPFCEREVAIQRQPQGVRLYDSS